MRIVQPYRPFVAESAAHRKLGPFDWIGALRMSSACAARACQCEVVALTDVATPLPVPALAYRTTQTRLMLWILDVSLQYLQSADFDRDTVLVSPDILVLQDLRPWFGGDLGVLLRSDPQYARHPIMNSIQWWPVRSRAFLIALYGDLLAYAQTCHEKLLRWGADTYPLQILLAPLVPGLQPRHGGDVRFIEMESVLTAFSSTMRSALDQGQPITPPVAALDFKARRKLHLARYYDAVYGVPA